jgi:hypothetical protein
VAGELAGDGDRDDRAPLAAPLECVPALVERSSALVGTRAHRGGLPVSTRLERRACPRRPPLMPGRLDEQPARVRVAGLGDRAQAPPLAGRVLARGQAEEGAQRLRLEAGPVAELDREREGGQRRDAPQAGEPADDLGERRLGGELGDRLVEGIAARLQ